MLKNTSLIIFIFLFIGCQQNDKNPKANIDLHENSPGMNGGVFNPREINNIPTVDEKSTFSASNLALTWLGSQQEEEGFWNTGKWEGDGTPETNAATTGMVIMTFLSTGFNSNGGKWCIVINKSILWLIKNQKTDGSFAQNNFVNGICTMALTEATGMGCKTEGLSNAANIAVDYILKQQNPSGGFWYYGPKGNGTPSEFDDMAVTTWCMMGLKSAWLAGIKEAKIKKAFKLCGKLLDITPNTKDNAIETKGESWYRASGVKGSGAAGGSCQAMAMLIRAYLGWERCSPWLMAAAEDQIENYPLEYKGLDVHRYYFADLVMYQAGGEKWKKWYELRKMIIDAQRKDGDFKGSWDLTGCSLDCGGRILYTAMIAMAIDIPLYRWVGIH